MLSVLMTIAGALQRHPVLFVLAQLAAAGLLLVAIYHVATSSRGHAWGEDECDDPRCLALQREAGVGATDGVTLQTLQMHNGAAPRGARPDVRADAFARRAARPLTRGRPKDTRPHEG